MPKNPTVAVLTLGCKLNQSDSETIARRLIGAGVRVVDRPQRGADAFVINTCSVTHVADRKARHLVRLARRLSPDAEIILTGCYAETAPEGIAQTIGADAVVANDGKASIPDRLLARLSERGDPAAGCASHLREGLRTRAFVKIQEGCNELCSFCIVPYTRGREVSVPIETVVREVQSREAEGVLEVVLTGTQLGNYGRDLGWSEQGPRLLLQALLEQTSVPRIRMSSVQAQDISEELLSLWRDSRLCPHFHLPLQSGSDPVLERMRRRYTSDEYRRAVDTIRAHVLDVAITTDVIAGFPGETDEDFERTYSLCRDIGFAAMHSFPYSRRPHTGAERMDRQLPVEVRRQRMERLLDLGRAAAATFRQSFIGRTMDVLWEEKTAGFWHGLTGNYMRVQTANEEDIANRLTPTRLTSLDDDNVIGKVDTAVVAGM
ncbi:MAG: tRNA (N(6)-L-threonylcarbamoyladenosine(37)-C(2))-methylthiotransferase MtaB [Chloroflexi bacterium]|nr:tRNA (N(6)-L-threonylcarbamoyladenosine(37)-C(2))-methylthiotransferase MtaB [Chloroflexota bacterium]